MKAKTLFKVLGISAAALAFAAGSPAPAPAAEPARAMSMFGEVDRGRRAMHAVRILDLAEAEKLLDGADMTDPSLAMAQGLLLLYKGECDGAVSLLSKTDLVDIAELMGVGEVARGCARGSAGTVTVRDDERVHVRIQDDEDRALVPLLVDVALKARASLAKDLGVELPLPIRIDLVRDQFTLSAMSGLPEKAAQTTGTVAVAKWGRVMMISPRATTNGYEWLDTLAHELTHLALERGAHNKAPLWLQEGVATMEQTRWREKEPLDGFPSVDVVAHLGLEKGLGVELDKIGPSIAMLPSPEQAHVAYAEVESFLRYWVREAGDDSLPQLLVRLAAIEGPNGVEQAISDVSGADFQAWIKRWRAHIATLPKDLPPELEPGAKPPSSKEIAQRIRLGELLQERGHARAASIERSRAHALLPHEPMVRCQLAETLLTMSDTQNAAPLVERIEDIYRRVGRWHSLNGLLHPDSNDVDRPFRLGLALDPLEPAVACEEKVAPELPKDPIRAAICEAARRMPR